MPALNMPARVAEEDKVPLITNANGIAVRMRERTKPVRYRFETSPACAGAVDSCLTHLHNSHQVDDTEYADPDDIQKMPEHTQTHQP